MQQYLAYFIPKGRQETERETNDGTYSAVFPMIHEESVFEDSDNTALRTAKKIAGQRKQTLKELVKIMHKTIYRASTTTKKVTRYQ